MAAGCLQWFSHMPQGGSEGDAVSGRPAAPLWNGSGVAGEGKVGRCGWESQAERSCPWEPGGPGGGRAEGPRSHRGGAELCRETGPWSLELAGVSLGEQVPQAETRPRGASSSPERPSALGPHGTS